MMPTSINFKRDTDSQVSSSSTPALSSINVDMSLTETDKDDELDTIKSHVKKYVFRIWKFYHKEPHSEYSDNEQTMCGLLMKSMKKAKPESWWLEVRKTVVTALTNQRNNCIKSMSMKYKCKYSSTAYKYKNADPQNQNANNKNSSSLAKANEPNGSGGPLYFVSEVDTDMLLEMRKNICFYAHVIDTFAPCIIRSTYWNNDNKMDRYCCTTDQKLWAQHVLSVSDEAFLILLLLNYSSRWYAETRREAQKVGSDNNDHFVLHKHPIRRLTLSSSSHIRKMASGQTMTNRVCR